MLRGKYGYMAPEQYERVRLDARTDIFACGVLLFELLTGEQPFNGSTAAETMAAVLHQAPPPLGSRVACPRRLEEIVTRALAKSPAERFPDAEAMARELEAVLASEPDLGDAREALGKLARLDLEEIDAPATASAAADGLRRRTAVAPTPGDTTTVVDPAPPKERGSTGSRRRPVVAAGVAAAIAALAAILALQAPPSRPTTSSALVAAASGSGNQGGPASAAPPPLSADPPPEAPPPEASDRNAGAANANANANAKRSAATKLRSVVDKGVGTVEFRIRPWAEIFVDGRSVGTSPIAPIELSAGRHHVLFRNKNLDKERAVTTNVLRGETTTVRVDLTE
jgi:serine/threonine-protein kinase